MNNKLKNHYEAFYGLPNEVTFCKSCVISNQRPSSTVEFKHKIDEKKEVINFNTQNICSACEYHSKKKNIDWKQREELLRNLCGEIKKKKTDPLQYDCVVPGSGGKDSAFAAHILKYKYGLNPLTVTWAPHLYTDIGWKNFESWIHVGGFDNILFTPNGKLHRYLTKNAFENLLHPFQPFIIGQRIIGPLIAQKFNVPIVFYGENQAEYGNKISENNKEIMDEKFFTSLENVRELYIGGKKIGKMLEETNFKLEDFKPYIPLDHNFIKRNKIEVHYLGYYEKWDPQEVYYYASENTGFKPNPDRTEGTYGRYSSIDDKIDMFHYYTTLIKFGLGRASYDAAQEIRNGKIDRAEGVNLVKLYDTEFPKKYFKDFLNYISISENEFHIIVNKFRSPHLWGKDSSGDWKLRKNVFKNGLDD
tara:strand:+ start:1291 stop:2544 length:1254 start_codon:yes stop_codon:yes gene_type:complete